MQIQKNQFQMLLTEHKNGSFWRNLLFPVDFLLISVIKIYQITLSLDHSWWGKKLDFRVCRHWPSCSQYALEAIVRFGAIKGSWLAAKRVSRCHPYSRAEMCDPVPRK